MRWWRKLVSLITIEINVYIYYMKRQINTIFSPQKLLLYLSEKIVWANRVFPFLCNYSYKNLLCYSVGSLCSDVVNFAKHNDERSKGCEGENAKNIPGKTPQARRVENELSKAGTQIAVFIFTLVIGIYLIIKLFLKLPQILL